MCQRTVKKTRAVRMPARCPSLGVGKEIGGAIYLHRSYEHRLGAPAARARALLPPDFCYTVVKYSRRTGTVSFVSSPDFNESPEPVAGDTWTVRADGRCAFRPQLADPWIYHHKWLMVTEAYRGFNVNESRERSRKWLLLPGVDRSRIGRRSYWAREVLPRLNSVSGTEGGPGKKD